jgi:NAD(P)-dependent dehydrogenase (short-subunit alcohol dehydrogenase family)
MTGSFEGKTVLVTGGASGIGRATVELFVEHGANVVIADVGDASEHVAALGQRAHAVSCDVTDPDQVQAAIEVAGERFGGLDVVVCNAGIDVVGPLLTTSSEDMQRVLAVNLLGVFHGIRYGAAALGQRGGGAIVCTASVAGLGGGAMMGAYASSKAGVINLVQTAALELRPMNIRVNCVCPGIIDTPMLARLRENFERQAGIAMDDIVAARQGRFGQPEDIARAIVYLASDDAEFISGVALPVDNGISASSF